jgi:hypothetical protein
MGEKNENKRSVSPGLYSPLFHYSIVPTFHFSMTLFFSVLIPIIPLFQQSIIPILQKITLMDNGLLQKLGKL